MIRYERDVSGGLDAVCEIAVGVEDRIVRVPLGPWFETDPDPIGLSLTPVVALPEPAWVELARAGALRAGTQPPILLLPALAPSIGGQFLVAIQEGVEVLLVLDGDAAALRAARALLGRPIVALPLDDPSATADLLSAIDVDVHIAVPSLEGDRRALLRSILDPLEPEAMHHVVEVDPRPALDAAGLPDRDASLSALAAAAAGVLAGRLAAGNRRWRAARA